MVNGWLMQLYYDDRTIFIRFFKLFKIVIAWERFHYGSAKNLTFGLWRYEISMVLGYRKEDEFTDFGEA